MDSVKGKYTYLEHTADAKFTAFGKTLEQAFANAAEAFTGVITDPSKIKETAKKEIDVRGPRLEPLLFDFLDNLLFFMDTEGFLTKRLETITIKKEDEYVLTATAVGDSLQNYDINGDIKAITYNDMEIKQEDGVAMTIVLDL